jgi:SAM-dependent methyltransferase
MAPELAFQFGNPTGFLGLAIAREMHNAHQADYAAVLQHLETRRHMRLLEIGMGMGLHVPELMADGVDYMGVDRSQDMVDAASHISPKAWFMCADVCDADLPDCDAAIAVNTLQWWSRPTDALKAIKIALRGPLVIGVAYPPPRGLLPEVGQKFYCVSEIVDMLHDTGFESVTDYLYSVGGRQYIVCKGLA